MDSQGFIPLFTFSHISLKCPSLGGWFWIHSHTHTERSGQMFKHAHAPKGKLRQLLGTEYKHPQQTCRQTDDYLHDKDLKYSPPKRFPWSSSTTFHVLLQSGRAALDIKAIFQEGLKEAGFDSTSARTRRGSFTFFLWKFLGAAVGAEEAVSLSFPAEKWLMLSRNPTWRGLCVFARRNTLYNHSRAKPTAGTEKDKLTRRKLKEAYTFPGHDQTLRHSYLLHAQVIHSADTIRFFDTHGQTGLMINSFWIGGTDADCRVRK